MTATWSDLKTKGFVVVPGFLSKEESQALLDAFAPDKLHRPNGVYPSMRAVPPAVLEKYRPRLMETARAISDQTDVVVDTLVGAVYFSTALGIDFDYWHQDTESYYEYQDHYNYLNFWIPIRKPQANKSNMHVVPQDALEQRAPEEYARRRGRGASRFLKKSGNRTCVDYHYGPRSSISFDLDEIGAKPELGEGDLLLTRGDVFHKTQDADTDRVAVSFRMVNSAGVIRRTHLARMNWRKFLEVRHNTSRYDLWTRCFERAGKNELTIGEFLDLKKRLLQEEKAGRLPDVSFPRYLSCIARNLLASH